jgi:hypothetical protein
MNMKMPDISQINWKTIVMVELTLFISEQWESIVKLVFKIVAERSKVAVGQLNWVIEPVQTLPIPMNAWTIGAA